MIAYLTSIGEPTTELAEWALERNGFEVVGVFGRGTLAEKLKFIYNQAEDDFVRIDADVIVNRNFNPSLLSWLKPKDPAIWWWQFETFDWLKLDKNHSMGYITKEAIPILRDNIDKFLDHNRPETMISRINEFYDPRRFKTYEDELMGLHGYKGDIQKAKKLKHIRNQTHLYDFELAEKLNKL